VVAFEGLADKTAEHEPAKAPGVQRQAPES
jgi:hypothetical protein